MGEGNKSLAIRLTYSAPDRTLTDDESALLPDLLRTRLAQRLLLNSWLAASDPSNAHYTARTVHRAVVSIQRLRAVAPPQATALVIERDQPCQRATANASAAGTRSNTVPRRRPAGRSPTSSRSPTPTTRSRPTTTGAPCR